MRFAFADPPYPGRAHVYRTVDRPDAAEVDHAELLERLIAEYPDGWALATDSRGLWTVVPLLEQRRAKLRPRIGIWHQPDASPLGTGDPHGRDSRIVWAFEAIVFAGGRGRGAAVRDLLTASSPDRSQGFPGQKPELYTAWVLRLLGAQPGDSIDDLYPGSGAFGAAAERFLKQSELWPGRSPRSGPPRRTGKLKSSRSRAEAQDYLLVEAAR